MTSAVRWLLPDAVRLPLAPLQAGVTHRREELEAMRAEGLLVHVAGGVYLPADATGSAQARVSAIALVARADAVVGLATAAWLHGAPVTPGPVEVLVPHAAGPSPSRDGVREHRTTIGTDDTSSWAGLRVTTPVRTAADLARQPAGDRSLDALRWLLAHGVRQRHVYAVLRANGRFRHNRRARAVLRQLRDRGDTPPSGPPAHSPEPS